MINKNYKYIPYAIILALLFIIFAQRGCSAQTTKQRVIIPEKKGQFKNPIVIIHEKGKKDSIVYKDKIVRTENPFNKKLAEDFITSQKENDSLKTLRLYVEAIAEKEETQVFDNKNINLKIRVKTRGTLLSVIPEYIIKEREEILDVKQKNTVFAVYAGGGLKTNIALETLSPTVYLGIQNKKGDLIYTTYGLDKTIQLGYTFRILNIKK